jgi:hypothetical protein
MVIYTYVLSFILFSLQQANSDARSCGSWGGDKMGERANKQTGSKGSKQRMEGRSSCTQIDVESRPGEVLGCGRLFVPQGNRSSISLRASQTSPPRETSAFPHLAPHLSFGLQPPFSRTPLDLSPAICFRLVQLGGCTGCQREDVHFAPATQHAAAKLMAAHANGMRHGRSGGSI